MKKLFLLLDRTLVVIACASIIGIMLLTTVSVIGRYVFSMPIPDDLIMSEILVVAVVFLPMSYVQLFREHVFVTIFSDWLSDTPKYWLETFGIFVGVVTFGIIAAATFQDFQLAWDEGQYHDGPLELPEWPSRFMVTLGLWLLTIRLAMDLVGSFVPSWRAEPPAKDSYPAGE